MKVKMIGAIAFLVMISSFWGWVYADDEDDFNCIDECYSDYNVVTAKNEDKAFEKCVKACQKENCIQKDNTSTYTSIPNTIKQTQIKQMENQSCQWFYSCKDQVVKTITKLTGSDKVDIQYQNFLQYTRTIYNAYEKEYNELGKKAKTNLNNCASYYNCEKKACIEDKKQTYKKGEEWYKNKEWDTKDIKKETYQNQKTECTNQYIKDVETNCTTGANNYNANIREFNESMKAIRTEKNKAEQVVYATATYRKQYLKLQCDDYTGSSNKYNEEDKKTSLYQQKKAQCDTLNIEYAKNKQKIEEWKSETVDDIQAQWWVHFELTDSPREMLDIVVYKANSDMQIQETAMDGITSHGTAANCPANAWRITRTLCWVKENIHPYIQWIVYAWLSLSILLLIRNGFLLVTNTVHGSAPDIKKRILYIGVGIVILTGFYYLIDLFMIVFAFIFD